MVYFFDHHEGFDGGGDTTSSNHGRQNSWLWHRNLVGRTHPVEFYSFYQPVACHDPREGAPRDYDLA